MINIKYIISLIELIKELSVSISFYSLYNLLIFHDSIKNYFKFIYAKK